MSDQSRPMRIVHVLREVVLAHGGVTRAVLDLGTELADLGHSVTVITRDATDIPTDWNQSGRPASAPFTEAETLIRQADVLHLHTPWERKSGKMIRIAKDAGTPYVITPHGMLDDWSMEQKGLKKRLYLTLVGRKHLEGAAAVHCTAQAEVEQAKPWFPKGRAVVLPLVLDTAPFVSLPPPSLAIDKFGLDPERPIVLFISRIHYKKGLDTLMRASATLRNRGVNHTLAIAGTGPASEERAAHELADELKLEGTAKFLGMVSGEAKFSLMGAATASALPTHQENFGFVNVESLAAGTPTITTKRVDIWAELESSGGAVITERTPDAFADALAGLLTDPARADAMSDAGRTWALDRFAPGRIASEYEAFYRKLSTGADPRTAAS